MPAVHIDSTERDPLTILQHAEIAIARANQRMTDTFVYTPEVSEGISAQLALMAEVSDGIGRGEFLMYYQPKIHLATGRR